MDCMSTEIYTIWAEVMRFAICLISKVAKLNYATVQIYICEILILV